MRLPLVQEIIDKIRRKKQTADYFNEDEYNMVLDFFKNHQDFRNEHTCSIATGIEKTKCKFLKELCYKNRDLGMYFFEANADPQKYMAEYIIKNTKIDEKSKILEVGPGSCPVFDFKDYKNWFGIDKNYLESNSIDFNGHNWARNKYPEDKIFKYSWENISEIKKKNLNDFDIVVASHSYEHVFEPIKSLLEAADVLKKDGYLILFVPDGFSDEPAARMEMTHTLYLVPKMIEEIFYYSKAFHNLKIESFRPNYDYVIVAQKK